MTPGATPSGRQGWSRGTELAVLALVLSLVVYRFSWTVADPDLWGHVKFGEIVWKTGRVAQPDPFSYVTGGRLWVNHEWLPEVIYYLIVAGAGPTGLIVAKIAMSLTVFSLLYWSLRRRGVSPAVAILLLLFVIHFFIISLGTVRPLIATYPLFLLTLLLIREMADGRARWLWAAPPAFALWANLHPGFLAGLGVLGIWAAADLAARQFLPEARPRRASPSAAAIVSALVACILATALNPYGVFLWGFLLRTATVPRPDITEWQPLVLMSPYGVAYLVFVVIAAWGYLSSRRRRDPALSAVFLVTGLLPLVAVRHTPLATLAITVLAGEHIDDAWQRWRPSRQGARGGASGRLDRVLGAGAVGLAAVLLWTSAPRFSCIRIEPPFAGGFPARAVALIARSGFEGNLAIHFNWGLYAIYHLYPKVKVSVDGRRETGYSPDVYRENLNFMFGDGEWDALLTHHDTHLVLASRGSPTANLMALKPGWVLLHQDPLVFLFGRADLPRLAAIRQTPLPSIPQDGAGLCFP